MGLAQVADDLWVDEVVVVAARGPDPLTLLAAAAQVTTTVGLVAGLDASVAVPDATAAAAATALTLGVGRVALLIEGCAGARDRAEALVDACRAASPARLPIYVAGPPLPEVGQLAATVADGWQFPPGLPLDQVGLAATAVGERRLGTGRPRALEVRTVLTPTGTDGADGADAMVWDLGQVAAHFAAGAAVVVADLDDAVARGVDPRVAIVEVAQAFADRPARPARPARP
ncbi:MAG TPA: hypothetical protein VF954_02940 [Acidimicrobiales bacterium]